MKKYNKITKDTIKSINDLALWHFRNGNNLGDFPIDALKFLFSLVPDDCKANIEVEFVESVSSPETNLGDAMPARLADTGFFKITNAASIDNIYTRAATKQNGF